MQISHSFKVGIWVTLVIFFATFSFYAYQIVYVPNFALTNEGETSRYTQRLIHIPTGTDFKGVLAILKERKLIDDDVSFAFLAKLLDYQTAVKPGAYTIPENGTNKAVITMLKRGTQTPVKFSFQRVRLLPQLVAKLDTSFECNAEAINTLLIDSNITKGYGFTPANIKCMFIPNTYEIYWNATPTKILDKCHKAYLAFWTEERKAKAKGLNLTQLQVSVLASIVQGETEKVDEMPVVAQVYKNRLDTDMKLQADPTVIYAHQDFTIKRVKMFHAHIDSPYNTYRYKGLPPGPINIPTVQALDAVLNMKGHHFIYFCAKEDFSGYHNFTDSYAAHKVNAKNYQNALTKRNIR